MSPFKLGDADYTPMFAWFGAALFFLFLGLPALFLLYPFVGPIGMLVCFGVAFGCLFMGMHVGSQITYGG